MFLDVSLYTEFQKRSRTEVLLPTVAGSLKASWFLRFLETS